MRPSTESRREKRDHAAGVTHVTGPRKGRGCGKGSVIEMLLLLRNIAVIFLICRLSPFVFGQTA